MGDQRGLRPGRAGAVPVHHPWGRQFWRITGGYFTGRHSIRVWLMFGVLLFSVVLAVRLNVLFSYQGNDMYTALQKAFQGAAGDNDVVKNSGVHGFGCRSESSASWPSFT